MRADDLERVTAALTRKPHLGIHRRRSAGGASSTSTRVAREILGIARRRAVAGIAMAEALPKSEFAARSRRRVRVADRDDARARCRAGARRTRASIGLTTVPLLNEADEFLGMLALFTDLTPIGSLESRVREMQTLAELGEISAGIAHEFRNSLSTILGYMRLARNGEVPAAALRSVDSAEREATQLARRRRRAAGLRASDEARRAADGRLRAACRTSSARIAPQHDVPITCSGEEAIVDAEAPVLARAFENLVRNAVESVEEKGSGDVRVSVRNGRMVEIRVEDSGTGIDNADVPRLFLPFQSNKRGGYGIGLALVKKIVLLHEGHIRLTGQPGEGATAVGRTAAVERPRRCRW